ncbi:MAG: hypothetical protein R3E79_33675 [Caldilineaceae bacterium]
MNTTVFWGLGSALTWGIGDFCGGLATRRTSVWTVVLYSQAVGMVLLFLLVLAFGEAMPRTTDLAWGAAAGLAGIMGLTALYQAMALGQMALVAPLTALIALSIPVLIGILTAGWPASATLIGFVLAALSVMLISYAPQRRATAGSLWIALVAGCGFGGFFVLSQLGLQMPLFLWPMPPLARLRAGCPCADNGVPRCLFTMAEAILPIVPAGVFDAGGGVACFVL